MEQLNSSENDLRRFRSWLKQNEVPVSTGYEIFRRLGLKVLKVGRASYVDRATRDAFMQAVRSGDVARAV